MTVDGGIVERLAAASAAVGPIGKDDRNTEQGFSYRGIERIMREVGPALATHGVVCSPEVRDMVVGEMARGRQGAMWRHVTLTIRYRFSAPDGTHVDAVVVGEGLDNADKASSKAQTMAWKQALIQVLSIGDGQHDADAFSPPEAYGHGEAPRRAQEARTDAPPASDPDPALEAQAGEMLAEVRAALDALPEDHRDPAREAFRQEFGNPRNLPFTGRVDEARAWLRDYAAQAEAAQAAAATIAAPAYTADETAEF